MPSSTERPNLSPLGLPRTCVVVLPLASVRVTVRVPSAFFVTVVVVPW